MTNKEAIRVLQAIKEHPSMGVYLPDEYEALHLAIKALEESSQSEWIPVTYRPMTGEERIAFAKYYGIEYCDTADEKTFDCPLPEDGQEILISTSWGVLEDVAENDIDDEGFIVYGLYAKGDWKGVDAWMPKPKPYKGRK